MNSVVFSSRNFFRNAILTEDTTSHKLTCEFDLDKNMSVNDINVRLLENDGEDLYDVEYVVDGDVNKTYYGYIIIDSITQVETITDGYHRCKVVLRYPSVDELVPVLFKSLSKLAANNNAIGADIGGIYAQVTSDLRILMMDSLSK